GNPRTCRCARRAPPHGRRVASGAGIEKSRRRSNRAWVQRAQPLYKIDTSTEAMRPKSPTLSYPFTAQLPPALAASVDASALEAALWALVARARAAFPTIDVDPTSFIAHVAARIPADSSVEQALEELYAGDLYLACACSHGDPAALRVFEQQFLSRV